jgi:hypothetical protein
LSQVWKTAAALNASAEYLISGRPAMLCAKASPIRAKLGMLDESRKAAAEAAIGGFLDGSMGKRGKL